MSAKVITIISGIILYLIGMCLHYRGKYLEVKDIAEKLSEYIRHFEENGQ